MTTFSAVPARSDLVGPQERPVDDRHDAGGGAVDGAERVELLEEARRETGGLGEGAGCRGVEALGGVEPAAGQRPQALVRVARAAHERDRRRMRGRRRDRGAA